MAPYTIHERGVYSNPSMNAFKMQSNGLYTTPVTSTAAQGAAVAGVAAKSAVGVATRNIPNGVSASKSYFMRELKQFSKKTMKGVLNWGAGTGRTGGFGRLGMFGVVAGLTIGLNAMGAVKKRVRWNREVERPSSLRAGPGFISWSKQTGMPANHLSTDGLSLALSRTRHVSLI